MRALDFIEGHNVLSPLLVLEILAEAKTLKFRVLKKFMKLKLKAQSDTIKQKKAKIEEIRNVIVDNQQQTIQMKTTAINFEQKECNECGNQLSLPTIHFTCGHTFHEFCIDS
jgi:vacuolar protein sorting-associated protein 11